MTRAGIKRFSDRFGLVVSGLVLALGGLAVPGPCPAAPAVPAGQAAAWAPPRKPGDIPLPRSARLAASGPETARTLAQREPAGPRGPGRPGAAEVALGATEVLAGRHTEGAARLAASAAQAGTLADVAAYYRGPRPLPGRRSGRSRRGPGLARRRPGRLVSRPGRPLSGPSERGPARRPRDRPGPGRILAHRGRPDARPRGLAAGRRGRRRPRPGPQGGGFPAPPVAHLAGLPLRRGRQRVGEGDVWEEECLRRPGRCPGPAGGRHGSLAPRTPRKGGRGRGGRGDGVCLL
uniref:Uncharacterized protein n=1 Tax=Desulfovibrio sp. U5L TaxID=596152 RepID=I2PYB2_9BACT